MLALAEDPCRVAADMDKVQERAVNIIRKQADLKHGFRRRLLSFSSSESGLRLSSQNVGYLVMIGAVQGEFLSTSSHSATFFGLVPLTSLSRTENKSGIKP